MAHSERGAALAAVLTAIALLLPLGALAVLQTRIGLLTQQSLRGEVEALHAADSGIACALAHLGDDVDLEALPAGPDAVEGTDDDGTLPFALECGPALSPVQSFDVRVDRAGGSVVLVATGRGTRGATRVVEQFLGRAADGTLERRGWRER
jgi:hypothetical protein